MPCEASSPGKCFYASDAEAASRDAAQLSCASSFDADLADVESVADRDAVAALLESKFVSGATVYLGGQLAADGDALVMKKGGEWYDVWQMEYHSVSHSHFFVCQKIVSSVTSSVTTAASLVTSGASTISCECPSGSHTSSSLPVTESTTSTASAALSEEDEKQLLQDIEETLHVNDRMTSSFRRRRTSAPDSRTSSTTIGVCGISVVVGVALFVVVLDVVSVMTSQ